MLFTLFNKNEAKINTLLLKNKLFRTNLNKKTKIIHNKLIIRDEANVKFLLNV